MSPPPTPPEPADLATPNLATQRAEDAQYYRRVLHKLIDMGTDLAEAVHRQATEQHPAPTPSAGAEPPTPTPSPSPSPQHAIAFDRLTRSVRRTIALARKLSEPAREAPGPKPRPTECNAEGCNDRRLRAPQRSTDRAEADAEYAEPCDRPEEPDNEDFDEDLDDQSFADLIARIGHDLTLAALPDAALWTRRTPQNVRGLCACAAGAGPTQPAPAQPGTGHPRPLSAAPPRPRTSTGPPQP